jgi:O-antigen/teichoic acid export membrane protein
MASEQTSPRLLRWSQLFASFLFSQTFVQGVAAATGLLGLWYLNKTEFAQLSLCLSVLTLFSSLTDMGSGSAINSIGGPMVHDRDRHRFGIFIATVSEVRLVLLIVTFPILALWSATLLLNNGATLLEAATLTIATLIAVVTLLATSTLRAAGLLMGNHKTIQKYDLIAATMKIACSALTIFLWPTALGMMLALALSGLLNYLLLKKRFAFITHDALPTAEYRGKIWNVVRSLSPNSIFFAVQGQLGLYIISFLGPTDRVADLGALGRFGIVAAIFGSVLQSLVAPRLARVAPAENITFKYVLISGLSLGAALSLAALALVAPDIVLLILGEQYSHLSAECFLALSSVGLTMFAAALLTMNLARGWHKAYAAFYIPVSLALLVATAIAFDLSTVTGALMLSATSAVATIALTLVDACTSLIKPQSSRRS